VVSIFDYMTIHLPKKNSSTVFLVFSVILIIIVGLCFVGIKSYLQKKEQQEITFTKDKNSLFKQVDSEAIPVMKKMNIAFYDSSNTCKVLALWKDEKKKSIDLYSDSASNCYESNPFITLKKSREVQKFTSNHNAIFTEIMKMTSKEVTIDDHKYIMKFDKINFLHTSDEGEAVWDIKIVSMEVSYRTCLNTFTKCV
jgi:hypothetical protein